MVFERPHYQLPPMQFAPKPENVQLPPMQVPVRRPAAKAPAGKQAPRARSNKVDVLTSLLSKAETGMGVPGPGAVPFGDLPDEIRKAVADKYGAPPIGFLPSKLTAEERAMLKRLQGMHQGRVAARTDADPGYAARMRARGGGT